MDELTDDRHKAQEDIAIIGMAGRFPGAPDIETFWANLRDGVESIVPLSDEDLLAAGVSRSTFEDPDYVKVCPVLDDVDKFDAGFFGFSPRDASVMDPTHRLFLEIAWHAFEHAGYTALPAEGAVGVFAGSGAPLYMIENLRTNPDLMRSMGDFLVRHTGNDMNFLATRVSYEMDLRGPSVNVQTACSSALVSLHMACQSLRLGECELAVAGGSTILFPQNQGYMYKEGEILSPDGHCRPFDAKSAGTVFGSGAGAIVVKRLSDALDDGDTIHAVIKGSAINNDGAMKVGYLAPGVDGQADVIREALAAADVDAASVSYVETHGTGTLVGDPIEVEALNDAYGTATDKRGYCGIGSVKSNIGHLGEAAAAASLIKAVMALKNRQLPPSLGFETPNPAINFDDSPFYVNDKLQAWTSDTPRRCAITALGAGGTNCHLILEEAPPALPGEGDRDKNLFVLSARSKAALDQASDNLADALEANPGLNLADAAYTMALGRRALTHRRTIVTGDRGETVQRLRERPAKLTVTDQALDTSPKTVFMFPGGGAQYARMGIDLYESEDVYREAVDECLDIITPRLGKDLKALMFAAASDVETATRTLEQPALTLPALFTTEYAMASLFEAWGVEPDAFIGHSMGEYVAACKAGVMSLEDAISLVMLRGELFEVVERGSMLSVPLSETVLRAILPDGVDIAAANAPDLCVASGPVDTIEALRQVLNEKDVESTPIRIDVAAHSRMLDPILDRFRSLCRTISFQPPQIPFVSNVTGKWITPTEACDPEYWVRHLRSTVRFADGLASLRSLGEPVLLEIGPGRTLSMLAKAQAQPFQKAFNSVRHPQEQASDTDYALTSLGRLWAAGADVDWGQFYGDQLRNRVPLPGYPFERQSYWVKPGKVSAHAASEDLTKREAVSDWFYQVSYREAPLVSASDTNPKRTWLVIASSVKKARQLAEALSPETVAIATAGKALSAQSDTHWRFDLDDPDQYFELLQAVEDKLGTPPDHVVMLAATRAPAMRALRDHQQVYRDFLHPAYVVQALGGTASETQLSYVTTGLSGLDGKPVHPQRALSLGPVLVAPRELEQLATRCIELPQPGWLETGSRDIMRDLVDELRAESPDTIVSLQKTARWVRDILPTPLTNETDKILPPDWVRDGGVYLITGGLGALGLEFAKHLAVHKRVKLLLLAREPLPPETMWEEILSNQTASRVAQRIQSLRDLRAIGADVSVIAGDITRADSLERALRDGREQYGPINGVIHAAGVMDDAPLMTKNAASMQRVLAPKVDGTLNLDRLITEPLDAFILFSSVASFLGLPGQIDYTAANAFLDAFARERQERAPGRTLVINWNAWRDVGMAANAHRHQTEGLEPNMPCAHPALDGYSDIGGQRTFVRTFSRADDWLLSEHVVKDGTALLSGTTFVELARAAVAEGRPGQTVELSNLTFLSPFTVAQDESRLLTLQMTPTGKDACDISIRGGTDLESQPLVMCEARSVASEAPPTINLNLIAHRCQVRKWTSPDGYLDQNFMAFGPRWANMKSVQFGHVEALVELELDERFAGDIGVFGLHPALLDMATGGVQSLVPGIDLETDFYVPLSYDRVRIYGDMPRQVFSHVTCLPGSGKELAYFDVTLADKSGRVIAQIRRFTMKKLEAGASLAEAPTPQINAAEIARNEAMEAVLREAITVKEGLEAFDRIMAQPHLVQTVASSVDVRLWSRQLAETHEANTDQDGNPSGFQRPDLDEDYEAPRNSVETALAETWSNLLGVRQVGINDDFFELGGNSLVGVRLFAAIRKSFDISLPLATLFEAPTIAQLAELIAPDAATPDADPGETGARSKWSPLVQLKPGIPGLRCIFAVHGAQGNIMKFKPLADKLPDTWPIYGLQAYGSDGKHEPLDCVIEMAQRYIDAIRTVQPHGPYTLAGYSGGGVIAYEMAQQLRRSGELVDIVIMFDTLEPRQMDRKVSWSDRLRNLGKVDKRIARNWLRNWLNDRQLLEPLMRRLDRQPEKRETTPLEEAGWRVSHAYHKAQANYQPKPYDGQVLVIRASQARMTFVRAGVSLGWAQYLAQPVLEFAVDATHATVFSEPAVSDMAVKLRAILSNLDTPTSIANFSEAPVANPTPDASTGKVHKLK